VLVAKVFSQFERGKVSSLDLDKVWRHSMSVAGSAQTICATEKMDLRTGEAAFTAGLLHDIGKLLLGANLAGQYDTIAGEAARRQMPLRDMEREAFGTTHAEVGACLAGIWGLPLPILEAIAWHHSPGKSRDKRFSLLTAVHAANVVDHESRGGEQAGLGTLMDAAYLDSIGMQARRNHWRLACGLKARPEEQPLTEKIGAWVESE